VASAIDSNKPVEGAATTASVRNNFSFAAQEINELQRATTEAVSAGGTGDAITASFTEPVVLTEGVTIVFEASGANASTTPTLNADTTGAKTIVKGSGDALLAGDIGGNRHFCVLRYDAANTVWVLMNPSAEPVATSVATSVAATAVSDHVAEVDPHTQYAKLTLTANETVKGLVERASQTETDAGLDDLRFLTALKLARSVIDSLTSTNTKRAGSANQLRVLNAAINSLNSTKVDKTSITSGTGTPSGGSNGDIYFRY